MTYKFSQDHLELLFGIIRLRLGCNDNPNVSQFRTSMKKILLKNDLRPSSAGNCALFDPIPGGIFDMCIRKRMIRGKKVELQFTTEVYDLQDAPVYVKISLRNEILRDNILFYVSGFISKKLAVKVTCQSCTDALFASESDHTYATSYELLTRFKNRGGLHIASSDVFQVVRETERQLRPFLWNLQAVSASKIVCRVKHELLFKCKFGTNCLDDDFFEPHCLKLMNNVCSLYLKIRMYSISKTFSDDLRSGIRNHSKKIVDLKNL